MASVEDPRPCAGCDLCCRLLDMPELDKPAGQVCRHQVKGGCGIHATRPNACRKFQCQWTITEFLDEAWRPDRAHFFIWAQSPGQIIIEVDPDHPDAWRQAPYHDFLKYWAGPNAGMQVLVRVDLNMFMVFPEGDVDMGPQQATEKINWGYNYRYDGKKVPFAYFGEPTADHSGS